MMFYNVHLIDWYSSENFNSAIYFNVKISYIEHAACLSQKSVFDGPMR